MLRLEPRLSPGLCRFALALLAVAVAAILASALPLWMGLPLSALAGLGVFAEVKQLNSYTYLLERGQWFVQGKSAGRYPLQLASTPLVGERVLAVRFRAQEAPRRMYRLFLLPDMVDAESWRRASLALRQSDDAESG